MFKAYPSNDNTLCVEAFACESIAVPACCNTCDLLKADVSAAKSASLIREFAADMFCDTFAKLEMVELKRF